MTAIWEAFSGYKTYIGMIAYGLGRIALGQEWITSETWAVVEPLIIAWTGIAVRSAMNKK